MQMLVWRVTAALTGEAKQASIVVDVALAALSGCILYIEGIVMGKKGTFSVNKHGAKTCRTAARWQLFVVTAFAAVLGLAFVWLRLTLYVVAAYMLLSVFTFIAYWWDKRKAQAGHSHKRTPESTLQFMALLGGWPGALLAQGYLRHKSQKRSFLAVFYLSLLLNLAALGWLLNSSLLPDIKI